jgi:pimeloyl-ACP methyl ester carboxylesterase
MSAIEHSFVEVDGCRTSLWRGGEGPPLLYLHGAQGVAAPMPFMHELASRFEVLAPEHPGFGRSDVPGWFDTIHDLAYFYLDFLAKLGLRDVYVVGQALGGWIAAEVAVRDTSRISRLVLAGAPGLHAPDCPTLDVFSIDDASLAEYLFHDPKLQQGAKAKALEMRSSPVAQKNRASLERVAKAAAFHDPDLHKWLHRIDVPTLLLWGAQDRAVPPGQGNLYRALIPGARLQLLQQCGHLPHVERAAEYVAALHAFCGTE